MRHLTHARGKAAPENEVQWKKASLVVMVAVGLLQCCRLAPFSDGDSAGEAVCGPGQRLGRVVRVTRAGPRAGPSRSRCYPARRVGPRHTWGARPLSGRLEGGSLPQGLCRLGRPVAARRAGHVRDAPRALRGCCKLAIGAGFRFVLNTAPLVGSCAILNQEHGVERGSRGVDAAGDVPATGTCVQ
jgi:hypothetical protein